MASHGPTFIIDARVGALLDADAAGWQAWGLDPQTATRPVAIDQAMPALQRLRQIACEGDPVRPAHELLTLWTARGVLRLPCRVRPEGEVGTFRLEACASEMHEPAHRNGHAPMRYAAAPVAERDAWLAHELKTPLGAVIAYAEMLKDEHLGPITNARYRGYARDIYEGARHALSVVDSMLRGEPTHSVVPPLAFAKLDAARVVESCLAIARPLAERAGLVLTVEVPPRLPRVVADELSLKQMLLNLLTNAIKFARAGDRVIVSVDLTQAGQLRIAVTDTGPGISAGGARNACASGLGLGLPLTRVLAAANGASLDLASEPDHGTRATITFAAERVVAN